LGFSKVWAISDAIKEAKAVDLHPTFEPSRYFTLREAKLHTDTSLRVAPDQPEIMLFKHRLYTHEFLTNPPLREFRCIFNESEIDGPLQGFAVAFCVRSVPSWPCAHQLTGPPTTFFSDTQPDWRDAGKLLSSFV